MDSAECCMQKKVLFVASRRECTPATTRSLLVGALQGVLLQEVCTSRTFENICGPYLQRIQRWNSHVSYPHSCLCSRNEWMTRLHAVFFSMQAARCECVVMSVHGVLCPSAEASVSKETSTLHHI